jgi:hypothetical protein
MRPAKWRRVTICKRNRFYKTASPSFTEPYIGLKLGLHKAMTNQYGGYYFLGAGGKLTEPSSTTEFPVIHSFIDTEDTRRKMPKLDVAFIMSRRHFQRVGNARKHF